MNEEILALSEEQIDKIIEFIDLTDREMPDANTSSEQLRSDALYYLKILEAFDNDPIKAAECWNAAEEKAFKAGNDVCAEMLAHIPNSKENFYDYFETREEADAYKAKVLAKSSEVSKKVLNEEFYDKFYALVMQKMDISQTQH